VFILCHVLTEIEGPNPFSMVGLFIIGGLTLIVSILIYLIADTKLNRKLLYTGILIAFQILILPIIWFTNDIKLRVFLSNNQRELELITNNVLDNKWTWQYAEEYTSSKNLPLQLIGHIEEDKTILFFISGITDNCLGIAYSRTGNEATRNNCGRLVTWKRLKDKWYEWGTI
jgi:hypothetical protein